MLFEIFKKLNTNMLFEIFRKNKKIMLFKKHVLENDVKKIAPTGAIKGSETPKIFQKIKK